MTKFVCKYCGNNSAKYKPVGPHIGEYCEFCGKWIRWVPKSENVKTTTTTKDLIDTQLMKEELKVSKIEIIDDDEVPW